MRKRNHYDWLKERQKTRKLRKQDKRAAALLIATELHIKPKDFADGCDGRWSYWSCDYWGEWDEKEALHLWQDFCHNNHPNVCAWMGFDKETGQDIPKEKRPRWLKPHEWIALYALRPPAGFRWRGRRVVPVDKHGAMVRQKGKQGEK